MRGTGPCGPLIPEPSRTGVTLGFHGLIVPLMLALGYDRMVAIGTIILGAGIGVLRSTVNPFATGVASSAADISLGDGIVLRGVMWVVLTAVTIGGVALAMVGYDRYLRFLWPLPAILAVPICGFVALGAVWT